MVKVAEFESRTQFARWIYDVGEQVQILLVIAFRHGNVRKPPPIRWTDKQYWVSYKDAPQPVRVESEIVPVPEPDRRTFWSRLFHQR